MLNVRRIASVSLALVICFGLFAIAAYAQPANQFVIASPYEGVDWAAFGQYKAAFHVHTTQSDGAASVADTVRDHYNKGFDILTITDHNVLTDGWGDHMAAEEIAAIYAGTYRGPYPGLLSTHRRQQQNGMISIPATNEQSRTDHICSYWAPFNNESSATMQDTLGRIGSYSGLAILNHPGRYTGGVAGGSAGAATSNDPANIAKYVELFREFDSAVGMEIINKLDDESKSDRILWDNILMQLMPEGRGVWGFSNDDSHFIDAIGYSFNVMLMPELTANAAKASMQNGAFYAVSRVARPEGVNTGLFGLWPISPGNFSTLYMFNQSTPGIVNIIAENDSITITGTDYSRIEWIADGRVIATGPRLDLNAHQDSINHNYVRAQLISGTGIAFTQPFGIWAADEDAPQASAPGAVAPPPTGDSRTLLFGLLALMLLSGMGLIVFAGRKKTSAQ